MVAIVNTDSFQENPSVSVSPTISSFTPAAGAKQILVIIGIDGSPDTQVTSCTIGGVSMDVVGTSVSTEGRSFSAFIIEAEGNSGDIVSGVSTSVGYFIAAAAINGYLTGSNIWGNNSNPALNAIDCPDNSTSNILISALIINLADSAVTTDAALTVQEQTTDAVQAGNFYGELSSRNSTGSLDNMNYWTHSNQQWTVGGFLFSDMPSAQELATESDYTIAQNSATFSLANGSYTMFAFDNRNSGRDPDANYMVGTATIASGAITAFTATRYGSSSALSKMAVTLTDRTSDTNGQAATIPNVSFT